MTLGPDTRAEAGRSSLRLRQTLAVAGLELGRSLKGWRSLWLLFLAFAPCAIIVAHALHDERCRLREETLILAGIVQFFYLRFAVFFGCLGIFVGSVRGEVVERTLHYAFLAPLRREVLVAGKFLAAAVASVLLFGAGVFASFAAMYAHFPAGREFVLAGGGLRHLFAYLVVTTLACLGYGALFLALSLVFRNPIVPAITVLLWETVSGALPVWLKHLSVTFYLKPLLPVELPVEGFSGLFTIVAEPMPPWLAVSRLIAFVLAVLAFACWRIRGMEVSYSTD
jgi:ABC-type transport system involved in multi-copper enzyme maturation permease subunit